MNNKKKQNVVKFRSITGFYVSRSLIIKYDGCADAYMYIVST